MGRDGGPWWKQFGCGSHLLWHEIHLLSIQPEWTTCCKLKMAADNWHCEASQQHSSNDDLLLKRLLIWSSRASLTVRITVKNGNPPGTGKIWENRFFTGKMDHHGAKCTQIGAQTCQGSSRTCRNFYTFTFKAVGVTFLKVTFHLLKKSTKIFIAELWKLRFTYITVIK